MLRIFFVAAMLCFGGVQCQGWCVDSYSGCAFGSCCVDTNNKILSLQLGAFGPQTHNGPYGGSAINGTCVQRKAQKGEMCDAKCQCATGLRCYRKLGGPRIQPFVCYDTAYVILQEHHWASCMADPVCSNKILTQGGK